MQAVRVVAAGLVVTVLAALPQVPVVVAAPEDGSPAGSPAATDIRPYWRQNLVRRIWFDQRPLVVSWWPAQLARPQFSGTLGSFWNYGEPPPGQEVGSFPSGHAQVAFTVAAVYATIYPNAGRALRAVQAWRPAVDPAHESYALYWVRTW